MTTRKSSAQISTAQAKQALLRSGYLLESRLEAVLRNRDNFYLVEANAAVPDPDTHKSRELDLYAMSPFHAGPDETDWVFAVVLIECVNNPQPIALLTKQPQVGFLHHYEVKLAGLPVKIPLEGEPDSWQMLADYLQMDKYHHYCKGRVATQFCSFTKKKAEQEWMATHDEAHFDSFRKLCAAVDHFADRHFKSWVFDDPRESTLSSTIPWLSSKVTCSTFVPARVPAASARQTIFSTAARPSWARKPRSIKSTL
jgi:hypothetical protein